MNCRLLNIVLFLAGCAALLAAQEQTQGLEISGMRFEGNESFRDDALLGIMQTKESPAGFWKFMYTISEKLGDKPEYFDRTRFEQDHTRLQAFYRDQGFFSVHIDTLLRPDFGRKTIALSFLIHEGHRSLIDSIQRVGFEDLPQSVVEEIEARPLVVPGEPYVADRVIGERARIVNAFFNNGYADVRVDSIVPYRYTSTGNIRLVIAITRGKRYVFGGITVRQDSIASGAVDEGAILRHLDFQKGDFYSEAKRSDSERNLNRLGVFETSRIEPVIGVKADTTFDISTQVFVRPRPFQELVPEIGVNDENNAFNILLGVSYNNRNFFGGARNFETKFQFQLQSIQDVEFSRVFSGTGLRDSSVIGNAELSFQINQPYFFNNKTSFTPSLSFIVEKRHKYYFNPIIRGRFAVTSQTARYTTAFLEWSLERIGYEAINATVAALYFDSLSIDRRPQFNSILSFTLQRDKRNDIFYPSGGFFHSVSIEEAGVIPSVFGSLFGTDLPYSKYVKLSGRGQWYVDPLRDKAAIWAFRLYGGVAELYGNSPAPVPVTRRFFGGGSGSVRGWGARGLAASRLPEEGGNAVFEGSIETRWNLLRNAGRLGFVEFSRFSLVFFYDFGNVWPRASDVKASEIAMAAGLGIRYATIAGPIRIDLGFRVYDPSAEQERQWISQKKFYKETLGALVLHFGIGHSF
ncbi:MAG: BamA/TamA family outer membrane protein [Ignavibacteriales bacterium]|nr:BamA/TamA family outer membrane protein [Ignavibacteriales bacterium]